MPARKEFYDVVRELIYDNEDAFRALRRQGPLQGHPPARIVQFRKFWDGLMTMADFWDTSADHYYYDTPDNPTDDTGGDDRAAMDVDDLRSDAQEADRDIGTANEGNSNNNNTGGDNESAMNIDDMPSDAHDADEDTSTANEENDNSQGKRRYTGHRISTGSEMSGRFRDDTVVAFVQTIALAFRCRLDFPQLQQQKLNMQGMVFPLPVAGSVYRVPKDRNEAKKGVREGPLLGVWPRDQLCFRRPGDTIGEGKLEALDLLKEVGLGMMLAQKRAREGKVEDIPGTEKWWAHAPRWGGGRGGRMSMPEEEMVELPASHVSQQLEGIPDAETVQARVYRGSQQPSKTPERETVEEPVSDRSQPRKNVRKTGSWPDIQPPGRTWEKNVKYQQVGRHWESDYDHVSHCCLCSPNNLSNVSSRSTSSRRSTTTSPSYNYASR